MLHAAVPDDCLYRIGHYAVRKLLGQGGYGRVYEAWDELLQRQVALKCLSGPGTEVQNGPLIREARMAASLRHPAIVRIFGVEDQGPAHCIVMELVRGRSLQDHVPLCVADPSSALAIVRQVSEAMSEAHAAGLVHGDLKPGNLMIEADGKVRILDFGLARHVDALATQDDAADSPLGTLAYMAPERLAGLPPSPLTDIYALGVVLYQLVSGERPHASLQGLALASAHMHTSSQQWHYPPRLAPPIVGLILAMTARDPQARLASMEAVRSRIAQLDCNPAHAGVPPAAAATQAAPAAQARGRRGMRVALLLAAAMLSGAGAMQAGVPAPPAPPRSYAELASMQAGLAALRRADCEGEIERALEQFGAVLAHRPGHAAAAAGQSLAYSMRYSGDERDDVWLMKAAAAAALALRADDQLALAHAAQSWAAALQGQSAQALAAADRALALDPSETWALTSKINILLRLQRQDAAAALLAQSRARWPNERAFADLEGTLMIQRGDYAAAEQAFRRSVALEPDAVLPYANLSAALLRQDRGDEALAVLQAGLRVQPGGALYTNLGTVLFDRGDFLGASAAFQHAVSAARGGPNDYLKWANLADALRWLPGREGDARAAYRRAMQLLRPMLARAPDDPTFLTRSGLYAARLGQRSDALALTARGAAAAPANPDVRFRAALANELSGQRDVALDQLSRAIALGYPFSSIEAAPELVALRRDARYQTLAMEHKR